MDMRIWVHGLRLRQKLIINKMEKLMENKLKHLEMVQSVINRMANNSFMLKGWAVTLVAGIFVLAGKDTDKLYFLVAYIPVIKVHRAVIIIMPYYSMSISPHCNH